MINAGSAGKWFGSLVLIFCVCLVTAKAQETLRVDHTLGPQATEPASTDLIQPEDLVSILKSGKGAKPLIIQIGFHVLYAQAHVPGSEYVSPGSSPEGVGQLRKRVESLPRTQFIVLYCGVLPLDQVSKRCSRI
jgi:hypothetical protein